MHSVFVAGSRALSRLTPQIRERLDNIMRRSLAVYIGDAYGADKAVQRYLAKHEYRHVVVYCMESCRNNVAEWPERHHQAAPGAKRDRHYFGIKDVAMAGDATCGFMLWDGVSKGTLTNTINLLNAGKSVVLYVSPLKQMFELRSLDDLHRALHANGVGDVSQFFASMGIKEVASNQLPFDSNAVSFPIEA
jgi:hypothetical protein